MDGMHCFIDSTSILVKIKSVSLYKYQTVYVLHTKLKNVNLCFFTKLNTGGIARSKHDGTCAETRFGLSVKRTSPFKTARVSVQSNAGSRGVRISGQQLYRPCSDVQCKTAGYPLQSHLSPSLPLPCVTMCHQVLNVLYSW